MNYKSIGRIIPLILVIEAAFMVPGLILGLLWHEQAAVTAYLQTIGIILVVSGPLLYLCRDAKAAFHEKEGFVIVGLGWIVLSLFGALPFWLSREIPSFVDAVFETASGFTTTGASILRDIEALDKSLLYWRSFSHWLGGMGVLVFLLALTPAGGKNTGFTMHLLRAESPGPSVGKLVPRIKKTAQILYLIYIALTLLDFILLCFGDMSVFEAFCVAVGTAGTGGFATINAGLSAYSSYSQNVTTVFMLLFGVNFSCYYLILIGKIKDVLKDEELRLYGAIVLAAALGIAFNIRPMYGSWGETLKHTFFQIGCIISTTGFSSTDFNLWPSFSKGILMILMITGACAGSTCGGMKVSRVLLAFKNLKRNMRQMVQPSHVVVVRNNKQVVSETVLTNVNTYLAAYLFILFGSFLVLTLDGFDITTTFTAALTCFNNVGPGLGNVGPTGNFADFSVLSKLVLILDMLAGRLEIFPILALFYRSTWKQK